MITASSVCTDVDLLNVLIIFKKLVGFGTIVAIVILIVLVMVDIVKTVASQEVDSKKLFQVISKRLMATIIVFLVPFVLNFVLSIIPMETSYYVDCYNNATDENLLYIAENNVIQSMNNLNAAFAGNDYDKAYIAYEEARLNIKKIPDKDLRKEQTTILETYKEKLNSLKDGENISASINATEGDYLTDNSANKYTYEYIEKNLKKYDISDQRIDVVLTAASYVGKIPYYWGGTASSSDFAANNFGSTVTADYNGRNKKGLDCSHFVDFVFWQVTGDDLGNSNTTHIWNEESRPITESELLPGDVGFQNAPSSSNHIGIYAGTDDNGKKIWIHLTGAPINTVIMNNTSGLPEYRRIEALIQYDEI